jgi:hypothetical protein
MSARRTTRAGASDSDLTDNDHGTGPATSVFPALSANEYRKGDEDQPTTANKFGPVACELTHRDPLPAEVMPIEEEDSPDVEVMKIFRLKIAGLRRLPKHQRAQAIRLVLEWLWSTMAGLREKRLYERHARHTLRQQMRMPMSRL